MNREQLLQTWQQAEQEPFRGWDFSHLHGRMIEEETPWSYLDRAAELMRQSHAMLDLETGDGERLLDLRAAWPPKVVATESYPPNFQLASERLAPLGVTVFEVASAEDGPQPFADEEFDLILNRHASFNPAEVARMLAPGGTFLTQQVHGLWAHDLLAVFGAKPQWLDATPERYLPRLQAAGLEIVNAEEWSGALTFSDVATIVYYLKAVPWLVPGFSVATHQSALWQLQEQLVAGEALRFTAWKYLIEARKPA